MSVPVEEKLNAPGSTPWTTGTAAPVAAVPLATASTGPEGTPTQEEARSLTTESPCDGTTNRTASAVEHAYLAVQQHGLISSSSAGQAPPLLRLFDRPDVPLSPRHAGLYGNE